MQEYEFQTTTKWSERGQRAVGEVRNAFNRLLEDVNERIPEGLNANVEGKANSGRR
jgi:hypothetical protein